ncbi:glycosyltransferase [Candidatus Gracilibacteria bacterium]|nr:glycosyltransferase [Candidatus Gracilibacteria bacterium]
MKIAILHEMLVKLGGAEKVIESLLRLFPQADIFTLIYDETKVGSIFSQKSIHPQCKKLPTQKIYNLTRKQRLCLPFMARSVESLDFSTYDFVLVSSSGFAHGLITKPETKTLVYYHAPARYMWDRTHEHTRDIGLDSGLRGYIYSKLLLRLRQWDYIASQRNDILLANSSNTQSRVMKYFRRESEVLYPPVETDRFAKIIPQNTSLPSEIPAEYYIIISTLTEFKRIDIAVSAFRDIKNTSLIVIGDGEYRGNLEKLASENTQFVGAKFGDNLVSLVQGSLGLIFPGEEDFGIVPIEVMAAGKPVFALKKGGLLETVIEGKTGAFFNDIEGGDFVEKFNIFHKSNLGGSYTSENCKQQAQQFSEAVFHKKIKNYIYS